MILIHKFIRSKGAKVLKGLIEKGKWRRQDLPPAPQNGAVFIDTAVPRGIILSYHI